jgi:NAD(P)-dependent dehydrogenase (short-subunit alcohol dehydrogenase family)
MAETGTILLTGATGSLAIPAIKYLLNTHPTYTCVLTVRNASKDDTNTNRLRDAIRQYEEAGSKIVIQQLDLSDLSAVHEFARTIAREIASEKLPPLASIICTAYYWNLKSANAELTVDGYDKTFQVNHLAHTVLVLRLLGSFRLNGGRVVLFSSDAHWPGQNGLEKYPPSIPEDLELLIMPANKEKGQDVMGRAFLRYANSKLVITMWMYALNRYLQKVSITFLTAPSLF